MNPTGKSVTYSGILIYRVAEGRIAEQWTEFDYWVFSNSWALWECD